MDKIEGFTPGPWVIVERGVARVMVGTANSRVDAEYRNIAQVIHPAMIGTLEANAVLIAQAPTLYARVQELEAAAQDVLAENHTPETYTRALVRLRAALSGDDR